LNAVDEQSFIQLLNSDEYDFRYECGVCQLINRITIEHWNEIVSALAMHSIFSIKAELDEISVVLMIMDWEIWHKAMQRCCDSCSYIIDSYLLRQIHCLIFFQPNSSAGSNVRELEEAALMYWVHYTQDEEDDVLL